MATVTLRELLPYDVNLSLVFTEAPLLERPALASAAGFDAVELWWPFAEAVPGEAEVDELASAIEDAGVRLVGLNLFSGDLAAGDKGVLSDPARVEPFRANIPVVAGLVERLGIAVLNGLVGNRLTGLTAQDQLDLAVDSLAHAARDLASTGATVVVEAMNPFGAPDYLLHSTAAALDVVRRASDRAGTELKLLYDVFHMQQAEGNLIATIGANLDDIGHVQIADVPGRSQPGTGEIAYPRVLRALADHGYQGFVGLEYQPTTASTDSFVWLEERVDHIGSTT